MDNTIDESMVKRITIDFDEVNKDIHTVLDELLQFKVDRKIRAALGSECIDKLREYETHIKRRLEDDFSIVIIGDFKRGKSTLINALLGEEIVTTNISPETVTINRISYGDKNSAEAVLKDGRRAMLDMSELSRQKLEEIISRLPSKVDYIDIKAPLESLKGIKIVDTPGVGDLLSRFDEQVKNYMVHADAVIYVVSALSPLSETEQTFLCASILPQNFSKLFVVVNMLDCVDDIEDADKITNHINSRLSNIFPNSYVYGISALDEYCRKKGLKRPNPVLSERLEKAFEEMNDTLSKDVITKKEIIQTERSLNMVKTMINEIEGRVSLIDNMLLLNQNKLKDLIYQYQNENSDLMKSIEKHRDALRFEIRELQKEAKGWMEEFLGRLENEVRRAENTPLETLEKHFHFYMIDVIRAAITECTNTHLKTITNSLKNASNAFATEFMSLTQSTSSAKIASSISSVSWTNLDATAVALNFIPGLGALTILGQAIIGFAKQNNTGHQQKIFITNVLSNFSQIKNSVLTELKNVYENIILFSEEQLNKIYESQVAVSIDAIKQAQDIALKEDVEKDEVKEGLVLAREILENVKARTGKYFG